MRFSLDASGLRVCITDAEEDVDYFCPACAEKMVQRHGTQISPCFAHFPNSKCSDAWRYDESDWHAKMQSLFPNENQEIFKEVDGKKHRADVLYEDRKIVIEFQQENIRKDEFEQRNAFFNKLGYKVIWVFDKSLAFESGAIEFGERRLGRVRTWKHRLKLFDGFSPADNKNVEVWFQRSENDDDKEPRFFKVTDATDGMKNMNCGFCHSLSELLRYLRDGLETPDFSRCYDKKRTICRTDGSLSYYFCPSKQQDLFFEPSRCKTCRFNASSYKDEGVVKCTYRFEEIDWGNNVQLVQQNTRTDGTVESLTLANPDGEITEMPLPAPKTFLRTIPELSKVYGFHHFFYMYNAKTGRKFSVLDLSRQKDGAIKGRAFYPNTRFFTDLTKLDDAKDPVWFVVGFDDK